MFLLGGGCDARLRAGQLGGLSAVCHQRYVRYRIILLISKHILYRKEYCIHNLCIERNTVFRRSLSSGDQNKFTAKIVSDYCEVW